MEVMVTRPTKAVFRMREACEYLSMSAHTLRKYSDLGVIPCWKRGNVRVFNIEDLDKFRQTDFNSKCERPAV